MDTRINVIEIERLRSELITMLNAYDSSYHKLISLTAYFNKILIHNQKNINDAFLREFIDDYLFAVKRFDVWGTHPDRVEEIIRQLKQLSDQKIAGDSETLFESERFRLADQLNKMKQRLEGEFISEGIIHKALFPLIDSNLPEGYNGIIDSVTIKINKAEDQDKIILVPSDKQTESLIMEQCRNSKEVSLNYIKRYVKNPVKYHEIIISFDKRDGIYIGNSLGIALTVSMIEALLKFYNPAYTIKMKGGVILSGGVDEDGEVLDLGEEIASRKTGTVFFSMCESFVFPKSDDMAVEKTFKEIQELYPTRTIKRVPVENIEDVLNRRDLIEIKKINPVIRTAKFIRSNLVAAVITILLAVLSGYVFVTDFDTNPKMITTDGKQIYIRNINGKILWAMNYEIGMRYFDSPRFLSMISRIVDIDGDGVNEVLLIIDPDAIEGKMSYPNTIRCYSAGHEVIWSYRFTDSVISDRESLNTDYGLFILDTLTLDDTPGIYIYGNNFKSFSSAIFRLNLETGKRESGTIWSSGHTCGGIIKDIDDDGRKDLLCLGIDNGYEDVVLFGYEADTLSKVRPSIDEYLIRNYNVVDPIIYIRFQKSDFDEYYYYRTPSPAMESFIDNIEKEYYQFYTQDYLNNYNASIWYRIDYDFDDIDIIVDSRFRVMRDSLVASGELSLPYTDTKEYLEVLKNRIYLWKEGRWVRFSGKD